MTYSCKILLDSISETNKRLTTFEVTFPRIVLAEFNTHRMFSRNSASSRAIPFKKRLEAVNENPFIPERFPIDGKGMQPNSYIYGNSTVYGIAKNEWLDARDKAISSANDLYNCLEKFEDAEHKEVRIHKQIVNRLLEPFQWHTVIVTATEFDNFFKLRCDEDAQYEIRRIADLMYEAYHFGEETLISSPKITGSSFREGPQKLKVGEWHCPLVSDEDNESIWKQVCKLINSMPIPLGKYDNREIIVERNALEIRKKISVARCARVSYLTHDGKRNIEKDLELFEKLRTSGHWSPFEHVATPFFGGVTPTMKKGFTIEGTDKSDLWSGNFLGWKQYRKEFQDENCINFKKEN